MKPQPTCPHCDAKLDQRGKVDTAPKTTKCQCVCSPCGKVFEVVKFDDKAQNTTIREVGCGD